jgi:hypothetical protein
MNVHDNLEEFSDPLNYDIEERKRSTSAERSNYKPSQEGHPPEGTPLRESDMPF